jgi:hypothetical protein
MSESLLPHPHLPALVPAALQAILGVKVTPADPGRTAPGDLFLAGAGRRFRIRLLKDGTAHAVRRELKKPLPATPDTGPAILLLAAPFMGVAGRRACLEAGIAWMDLSGNAQIHTDGLLIRVEGRPNRFLNLDRPSSLFAAPDSRVVRWLLVHSGTAFTAQELRVALRLDAARLDRVLERMGEAGFLARGADGRVQVAEPGLLLEEWRESCPPQSEAWRRLERHFPSQAESGGSAPARPRAAMDPGPDAHLMGM